METSGTPIRRVTNEATRGTNNIKELGPWFHNIHLPGGEQTAPDHFLGDFPGVMWKVFRDRLPSDLTGWTALDIGCNAGFYSFELARRGARVTGIDSEPLYLRQAEWLAKEYFPENRPEFHRMQIHDLARVSDEFDLVLFMGVFYHLRYPQLALDTVAARTRRLMVFQTLSTADDEVHVPKDDYDIEDREVFGKTGWPKMAFIERDFSHDSTNWWAPNHACVEAMLRSTGFESIQRIATELYFCTVPERGVRSRRHWDEAEWSAATGAALVSAENERKERTA